MNAPPVATGEFLVRLAAQLGARVTSWKRTAAENAAVGGSPTSLHLVGDAVDLAADTARDVLDTLESWGFRVAYHTKGTAPHYHVEVTDTARVRVREAFERYRETAAKPSFLRSASMVGVLLLVLLILRPWKGRS